MMANASFPSVLINRLRRRAYLLRIHQVEEPKFLLHRDAETHAWELPGGEGWEEEKLVGWDVGARIGSLQETHPNTTRFRSSLDVLHRRC